MTNKLKAATLALAAMSLAAAPVAARADEIYFLVGTRHVFRIGPNPYIAVDQRKQIEADYGAAVAGAKSDYDNAVNGGQDPAAAADQLNQRLNDAAAARDYQLSQIYAPDDAVLAHHPELAIQGDGPYQVLGIDVANHAWLNYRVFAPWPGYVTTVSPYGWVYGRVYSPYAFHHVYIGWYNGWVAGGSPLFVGLWAPSGFIHIGFSASINLSLRAHGFAPGPGFRPGANWHGAYPRAGSFGRPGLARPGFGRPGLTRPGVSRPGGSFGRPGVTRPGVSRPGGSFGRPGVTRPGVSRPGGSFGRPGASRPGGSFGRPGTARPGASRPGGSFGRPGASRPGGSFGHGSSGGRAPSRPSGGGNSHRH